MKNHQGGRPSKLYSTDQKSIINQIFTGKIDNAIQATNYTNAIIQHSFHSQTVRNILKRTLKAAINLLSEVMYLGSYITFLVLQLFL